MLKIGDCLSLWWMSNFKHFYNTARASPIKLSSAASNLFASLYS